MTEQLSSTEARPVINPDNSPLVTVEAPAGLTAEQEDDWQRIAGHTPVSH